MQIIVIDATEHKGLTTTMGEKILQGFTRPGDRVENFRLKSMDFSRCIACGSCDETGECVFEDDASLLYEKLLEADAIVFLSPIYFQSISALGKCFVDRMQSLFSRERLGWKAKKSPYAMAIMSAGAPASPRRFLGAEEVLRTFFMPLGVEKSVFIGAADTDRDTNLLEEELQGLGRRLREERLCGEVLRKDGSYVFESND